jgi:peptide-methionine (S)-S-oxide reductase
MSTVVGYSGATDPDSRFPTYRNIQDYAEAIRITFDTDVVTYENLLDMFFAFHTPGPMAYTGTQYRSAIFYHTAEQRMIALDRLKSAGRLEKFVVLEKASDFYRAEEYHQNYLVKSGTFR